MTHMCLLNHNYKQCLRFGKANENCKEHKKKKLWKQRHIYYIFDTSENKTEKFLKPKQWLASAVCLYFVCLCSVHNAKEYKFPLKWEATTCKIYHRWDFLARFIHINAWYGGTWKWERQMVAWTGNVSSARVWYNSKISDRRVMPFIHEGTEMNWKKKENLE